MKMNKLQRDIIPCILIEQLNRDAEKLAMMKLASLSLVDADIKNKQQLQALKNVMDLARESTISEYRKQSVPLPKSQDKLDHTNKEIKDFLNDKNIHPKLLMNNNDIVGGAVLKHLAYMPGEHYSITDLGVLPEYQGQGYGKKLMGKLLEASKGMDSLELAVAANNLKAKKLYGEFGFKPYREQMILDKSI